MKMIYYTDTVGKNMFGNDAIGIPHIEGNIFYFFTFNAGNKHKIVDQYIFMP